jgi:hypothetical protein
MENVYSFNEAKLNIDNLETEVSAKQIWRRSIIKRGLTSTLVKN